MTAEVREQFQEVARLLVRIPGSLDESLYGSEPGMVRGLRPGCAPNGNDPPLEVPGEQLLWQRQHNRLLDHD